jgi:alpha-glucosidase (family GH31 glycosyl hydrolase)
LYSKVKFDDIWLDKNEVANQCDGEVTSFDYNAGLHDPNEFDELPYLPGGESLLKRAISPTGYHYAEDPADEEFLKEYNLHSLWSLHEDKATYEFFSEKLKQRPFVLTRANFIGSGMFASKWLGENRSKWEFLCYSIIGLYNYQMFDMPLVGANICGFLEDADEELCLRWMQLGTFYPFTRNNNHARFKSQEPYLWPKVAEASRNAIRQKYSILRYYYTKLFEVSMHGGTLIKPLFFDHPNDTKAYTKKNEMFMIGSALMIAPVVTPKAFVVSPHFSNENWFSLFSKKQVVEYYPGAEEGEILNLEANYDYVKYS